VVAIFDSGVIWASLRSGFGRRRARYSALCPRALRVRFGHSVACRYVPSSWAARVSEWSRLWRLTSRWSGRRKAISPPSAGCFTGGAAQLSRYVSQQVETLEPIGC